MDKAILTCALTGVLTNPTRHPVPVTPEECAASAREAFDAGASVVHIHYRQQGEGMGHLPSWDPDVAAAIEKEGPVDLSELGALAEAKGGQLLATPGELLAAAGEIKSRQTIETFRTPHAMWDSWLTVALVLFILAVEWWLRKRWNLL